MSLLGLTDDELMAVIVGMGQSAAEFREAAAPRVSAYFHALAVRASEEADRRVQAAEEARIDLDGPDKGGIYRGEPLGFDD